MTIGTAINQYRIKANIGAGGMGEVFRARNTRINRSILRRLRLSGLRQRLEVFLAV